jgi:hypothetical protein
MIYVHLRVKREFFLIEQRRSRTEARHYTGDKLRNGHALKTGHYIGTYQGLC